MTELDSSYDPDEDLSDEELNDIWERAALVELVGPPPAQATLYLFPGTDLRVTNRSRGGSADFNLLPPVLRSGTTRITSSTSEQLTPA